MCRFSSHAFLRPSQLHTWSHMCTRPCTCRHTHFEKAMLHYAASQMGWNHPSYLGELPALSLPLIMLCGVRQERVVTSQQERTPRQNWLGSKSRLQLLSWELEPGSQCWLYPSLAVQPWASTFTSLSLGVSSVKRGWPFLPCRIVVRIREILESLAHSGCPINESC